VTTNHQPISVAELEASYGSAKSKLTQPDLIISSFSRSPFTYLRWPLVTAKPTDVFFCTCVLSSSSNSLICLDDCHSKSSAGLFASAVQYLDTQSMNVHDILRGWSVDPNWTTPETHLILTDNVYRPRYLQPLPHDTRRRGTRADVYSMCVNKSPHPANFER
jgi:hypothetical protein